MDQSRHLIYTEVNITFVFITGEMGIVAGWGRLSEGGQLPSILQYVSSKILKIFPTLKLVIRHIHT